MGGEPTRGGGGVAVEVEWSCFCWWWGEFWWLVFFKKRDREGFRGWWGVAEGVAEGRGRGEGGKVVSWAVFLVWWLKLGGGMVMIGWCCGRVGKGNRKGLGGKGMNVEDFGGMRRGMGMGKGA